MCDKAGPIEKTDSDEQAVSPTFAPPEGISCTLGAPPCSQYRPSTMEVGSIHLNARVRGRLTLLAREAAIRHIDLRFLLPSFSRHRRNTTFARSHGVPSSMDPVKPLERVSSSKRLRSDPENAGVRNLVGRNRTVQTDLEMLPDENVVKENISRPFDSTRTLYWSLDLYLDADDGQKHLQADSVSEHTILRTLLQKALLKMRRRRGLSSLFGIGRENFYEGLTNAVSDDDVAVFLRNDQMLAECSDVVTLSKLTGKRGEGVINMNVCPDIRRFTEVNIEHQLYEVLQNKCIVEFPVFHVVRKGSLAANNLERACSGLFERAEDRFSNPEFDVRSETNGRKPSMEGCEYVDGNTKVPENFGKSDAGRADVDDNCGVDTYCEKDDIRSLQNVISEALVEGQEHRFDGGKNKPGRGKSVIGGTMKADSESEDDDYDGNLDGGSDGEDSSSSDGGSVQKDDVKTNDLKSHQRGIGKLAANKKTNSSIRNTKRVRRSRPSSDSGSLYSDVDDSDGEENARETNANTKRMAGAGG